MIDAKELRVGNLVTDEFYEHFKAVIKVSSINEAGINLEVADDGNISELAIHFIEPEYAFEKIYPIPLTPEILEKAGFAENKGDYHFENIIFLRWTGRYFLAKLYVDASSFASSLRRELIVNDVHQLQNLFYAISGEELEINLQ